MSERVFTVTPEGPPDGFGRVHFIARWHDGERHRGQVFHMVPAAFIENARRHGFFVVGFETQEVAG